MANTIQDKLAYLSGTKDAIKQAIIEKGVEVTDTDTFRSYADKIEAIQSGGSIAGAPSGIRFCNSTFTTVPTELFPYLEAQTDLNGIFYNCSNLQTVPLFDTSKATNMSYMFKNCENLQTVSKLNTSNVTTMQNMFYYCTSLTTVPLFDTSKVTTMSYMFSNCDSLQTVPLFDTSNVNDMGYMFSNCESLQTVPLFDTSNVNDMAYMFYYCKKLTTVPQFNTANVTNMDSIFYNCSNLQTVPLFNTANVTRMYDMFYNCTSLTNLGGFTGLKKSLNLKNSPLLTVDSVMNVINNAADMTSSPKTLALHKDAFNRLSQEHITTASTKGWNLASA